MERAIYHLEAALGIAFSFNWHAQLFWIRHTLARLYFGQDKFGDARTHGELAKSHAVDNAYHLGLTMEQQADFLYQQQQFEEAKSEVLRAAESFGKLGAADNLERYRELLQRIEQEMKNPAA